MPMSYSTPKPCGWQRNPTRNRRQLRGWVGGKLCWRRYLRSSVQKCQLDRRSNSVFEHRCWPRRTGRSGTTALYRRNSVGTRAQPPKPIPAHSRWPQTNESEPVYRPIGLRHERLPVRRLFGLRGLPPSAPTSNPTGFRLG